MAKLRILGLFSTVKACVKAGVLSSLLTLAFFAFPSSAYADFRLDTLWLSDSVREVQAVIDRGSSALVEAALTAVTVDIGVRSAQAVAHTDILDVIASGGNYAPPDYTFLGTLFEYLNRETIRIRPGSVTIGGVEYSDVWLPHDCADKYRTNAFDWITRYNISSETSGVFASGVGYAGGVPIFSINGSYRSQNYFFTPSGGSVGDFTITSRGYSSGYYYTATLNSSSYTPNDYYIDGCTFYLNTSLSSAALYVNMDGKRWNGTTVHYSSTWTVPFTSQPFDFDWVAGTIPVAPLSATDGLRLRVPSSYVAGLPQILDPDSSSYVSDLTALTDSLTTAGEAGEIVDPAFEAWDTPVPGSGTIADEPYSSLSGSLNGIQSIISSISSGVSSIADSIVGADSSFFGNIVSALAVPFEPVFAVFRSGVGIWRYVVSWVGTISAPFAWSLSALGSAGSIFLSPIYAAAAAAVVLAVYKKFGR